LPCSWIPGCSGTKDRCKNAKDGKYPIRDVFSYVVCKNRTETVVACPKGTLFRPGSNACVNGSTVTLKNFCDDRITCMSNWKNPWSCDRYIACVHKYYFDNPCQATGLVYEPDKDRCLYDHQYNCTTLVFFPKTMKKSMSALPQIKDICTTLPDGEYAPRDVFNILICKDHTSSLKACPKGEIYIPGDENCTDAKKVEEGDFCKERTDGNWLDPWDCHSYYTCSNSFVFKRACPASLNYDPVNDECKLADVYPCKQLDKTTEERNLQIVVSPIQSSEVKDPCTHLPDGNYAIRDVLTILVCKGHKHEYRKCPKGTIYVPGKDECSPGKSITFKNFCTNRTEGNWQNPWNCHYYITCVPGRTYLRKCSIKTTLNYDPYLDLCAYPFQYECKQLDVATEERNPQHSVSPIQASEDEDPCTHLPDGNYSLRDVLTILVCKGHKHEYRKCPKETIYVPGNNECSPAKSIPIKNFCTNRTEGNWQNPWNCHRYITCVPGRAYDRNCSIRATLNYDPYIGTCVYSAIYKCKQLALEEKRIEEEKSVETQDPCANLKDGRYAVRDVFNYLKCKNHKGKVKQCPAGKYFVAAKMKCKKGKKDIDNFCLSRPDGNWRNPWNCHDYITCHVERAFDRPCSKLTTLNYDPEKDLCEYPRLFPCKQIASSRIEEVIEQEEGPIEFVEF